MKSATVPNAHVAYLPIAGAVVLYFMSTCRQGGQADTDATYKVTSH